MVFPHLPPLLCLEEISYDSWDLRYVLAQWSLPDTFPSPGWQRASEKPIFNRLSEFLTPRQGHILYF